MDYNQVAGLCFDSLVKVAPKVDYYELRLQTGARGYKHSKEFTGRDWEKDPHKCMNKMFLRTKPSLEGYNCSFCLCHGYKKFTKHTVQQCIEGSFSLNYSLNLCTCSSISHETWSPSPWRSI
jgi:hypothetical protein